MQCLLDWEHVLRTWQYLGSTPRRKWGGKPHEVLSMKQSTHPAGQTGPAQLPDGEITLTQQPTWTSI